MIILVALSGCKGNTGKTSTESSTFELTEAWRSDTLLTTSESVIYDRKRDLLYVTCLNNEPRVKDNNGFISKLSTDGKIINQKWIEGMHSPKGTALIGDTLYAADIDELIVIDVNNSRLVRKVPVNGAGMLNDITSDDEGNLYISDSDANKIYRYSNGIISEWITTGLNQPNGLLAEDNRIFLASMGSKDLVSVEPDSKSFTVLADGLGMADGISFTGIKDHYIVTDWNGEIFLIGPDKSRTSLLNTSSQKINTADCEYIAEKNLLLIPTFFGNGVIAYKLTIK